MAIQQQLLGLGGANKLYLDDYFSILHYHGYVDEQASSKTETVYTGIDLNSSGNKGMIMITKQEATSGVGEVRLFDTERGVNKSLSTSTSDSETNQTNNSISAFNSNGFDLKQQQYHYADTWNRIYTFRACPGFFDIVTYTGNGSNRTIAHGLDGVPGMIWIKKYNGTGNWACYHRRLNNGSSPEDYYIRVNASEARQDSASHWNDTAPTSTHFSLGTSNDVNQNGDNYVAYLWSHNDARFGENGDAVAIQCGSYEGFQQNYRTNLGGGHEAGFLMLKNQSDSTSAYNGTDTRWMIVDNKRGHVTGQDKSGPEQRRYGVDHGKLWKNNNIQYKTSDTYFDCMCNGFSSFGRHDWNSGYGDYYIYMNIIDPRTGKVSKPIDDPLKCQVIGPGSSANTQNNGGARNYDSTNANAWAPDFVFYRGLGNYQEWDTYMRQTGNQKYYLWKQQQEAGYGGNPTVWYSMAGVNSGSADDHVWSFRRHQGFACGCYYGQHNHGLGTGVIPHHMGQTPKMIWVLRRDNGTSNAYNGIWTVYHYGLNGGSSPEGRYLVMNSNHAQGTSSTYWANTAPNATSFSVGNETNTGANGEYIYAAWADVAGVQKMGYYTGAGNSAQTITTGFRPKSIMFKSTTTGTDWKVFGNVPNESYTGLPTSNTGNDTKYLEFNTRDALSGSGAGTLVYTSATGFTINANVSSHDLNTSGDNYIYAAWG